MEVHNFLFIKLYFNAKQLCGGLRSICVKWCHIFLNRNKRDWNSCMLNNSKYTWESDNRHFDFLQCFNLKWLCNIEEKQKLDLQYWNLIKRLTYDWLKVSIQTWINQYLKWSHLTSHAVFCNHCKVQSQLCLLNKFSTGELWIESWFVGSLTPILVLLAVPLMQLWLVV